MELREVLSARAHDEQRLLELVEEVPEDSIYYHTHSYFLRHPYLQGRFPNDFASWAAVQVQDIVLGERLAAIDPFEHADLESLRAEIAGIIADHLNRIKGIPRVELAEPFEFVRSHVIDVDLEKEVWSLREFRQCLEGVEAGAIYNHVCEGRLRTKNGKLPGDFASWLQAKDGLDMPELAVKVSRVGRLGLGLEGMRERIMRLCDQALAA
jgi:hypothetical protein